MGHVTTNKSFEHILGHVKFYYRGFYIVDTYVHWSTWLSIS